MTLVQYIPKDEIKKLYAMLIAEVYHEQTKDIQIEKRQLMGQIKEYEKRLSNARLLIASGKIDEDDFRHLKTDFVEQINKLERKLMTTMNDAADIDGLLNKGIGNLMKLDEGIKKGDLGEVRKLIALIYPENLTFDGFHFSNHSNQREVHSIYLINKELDGNRKGQISSKSDLSCKVGLSGQFSNHFLQDLKKLAS